MKIMVNGTATDVAAKDLPGVLRELGYGDGKVATAINERFVPVAARGEVSLCDGDRLEVVTPRQGG